ncbi:FabD/lysophospholipase-like protein, partial [Serendipita vermifera]
MEEHDSTEGIRILSLDGGGPGCFSQLVILDEIMGRIAHDGQLDKKQMRPADYFDLMGGVGFGAYIGFMLGALRMTVKEAMKELHTLGSKLRMGDTDAQISPSERLDILKNGVQQMLRDQGVSETVDMQDPQFSSSKCKVALLAVRSTAVNSYQWFRTYPSSRNDMDCSVVDALSASMALPTLFSPVTIGPDYAVEEFCGGGFGFNNPTRELLKEAQSTYGGERRLSVIIGIGSGRPKELSLGGSGQESDVMGELLRKLALNCETIEKDISYQLYDVGGYIRMNVAHGLEDIQMGDWSQLGKVTYCTKQYLESKSVVKLLDTTIKLVMKRRGTMSLNQLKRATRIKHQAKGPPAVSPYFVVRKEEWTIMEQKLLGPRMKGLNVFVISGMGGCGKTQMVSYFVQEYHDRFKHIFFVDASSESSIKMDLRDAIRSLDGHQQDLENDAISFLQSHVNSLLIFDNANDPKVDLVQFFPRLYGGMILITTRLQTLRSLSTLHYLELGTMSHDEAIETLVKAAQRDFPLHPKDIPHVGAIIEELGYLSLALVQAGVYISNMASGKTMDGHGSVFEHYLNLLRQKQAILLRNQGAAFLDPYRHGVYAALDLSYTLLPSLSRDFLHLCSQLHYTNISVSMLLAAAEGGFEDKWEYLERPRSHQDVQYKLHTMFSINGVPNEALVYDVVQSLVSLSLVQRTMRNKTVLLHIHPLVYAWAQEILSSSLWSLYTQMAITVVSTSSHTLSPGDVQYLPPHIIKLMETIKPGGLHVRDMIQFGVIMRDYGFGRVAVELHERVTRRIEAEVGSNDKQMLDAYMILGNTYERAGRLKEAERIKGRVLAICHQIHGKQHPVTIAAYSNLAVTYRSIGKLQEAEELQIKVLEMQQEILGEQHPDTIAASNNLANTYAKLGKLQEAVELQIKVLEVQQGILGEWHPDTITASNNLAITYQSLGQLQVAEKLKFKVLEMRHEILGERHPDTISASSNLAVTYWSTGKLQEAEELQIKVLEMQQEILGEWHPDTITTSNNLAITYQS